MAIVYVNSKPKSPKPKIAPKGQKKINKEKTIMDGVNVVVILVEQSLRL